MDEEKREANKIASKKWREANREHVKDYKQKYRKLKRKAIRNYNRKYYHDNKEVRKQIVGDYRITQNDETMDTAVKHGERWTVEDIVEMKRLRLEENLTIKQIAVKIGRSYNSIKDILHRHGVIISDVKGEKYVDAIEAVIGVIPPSEDEEKYCEAFESRDSQTGGEDQSKASQLL